MGYIDPPIQERRAKRRGGCWLWGCGITAVIVVLVAVSCVTLFQYGKRRVAPSAETYLDLVTRGEVLLQLRSTPARPTRMTTDDMAPTNRARRGLAELCELRLQGCCSIGSTSATQCLAPFRVPKDSHP